MMPRLIQPERKGLFRLAQKAFQKKKEIIYNAVIFYMAAFLIQKGPDFRLSIEFYSLIYLAKLLIAETRPLIEDTMISECLPTPQYILSPQEIPTYETASDVDFLSE